MYILSRFLWRQCLLFISIENTTKSTITLYDRANCQLQNTIFQESHHHHICILNSNEQEPACHPCKIVHHMIWTTVSQLVGWQLLPTQSITGLQSTSPLAWTDRSQKVPNLDYIEGVVEESSQDCQWAPSSSNWSWALVLSCCKWKAVFTGLILEILLCSLVKLMIQRSELMVCPGSSKSRRITPFLCQKKMHIVLLSAGWILNFFLWWGIHVTTPWMAVLTLACSGDTTFSSNGSIQEIVTFSLVFVQ